MVVAFYILAETADLFFCPVLQVIGDGLHMSNELAGMTLLAFGNGAPDLSTSITSLAAYRPIDITIGSLFGASIFISTIIVAIISFLSRHVQFKPSAFIRDISFYLASIVAIYFITWDGKIYLYESVLFILFYISFVVFALLTHYCSCKKRSPIIDYNISESNFNEQSNEKSEHDNNGKEMINNYYFDNDEQVINETTGLISKIPDENELDENELDENKLENEYFTLKKWFNWFKNKNIIHKIYIVVSTLILFPLHLSIPSTKWNRYVSIITPITSTVIILFSFNLLSASYWIPITICLIVSACISVFVFFTTKFEKPPVYYPYFTVLSFIMSIMWIYMSADQVVILLQSTGIILNIPNFILGATVLAWGNSVGDLISDIVMAKKGSPNMALSATYAGPMFNMLLGLGIGMTIRASKTYPAPILVEASKAFLASGFFLFLTLYSTLIVLWINKFKLSWWWGIFLVIIYGAFSLVTGLIESHVIWN